MKANNIKLQEITVIKKEMAQLNVDKASKFDQSDLYSKICGEFVNNDMFAQLKREMSVGEEQKSHEMEERKNQLQQTNE